MDQLSEAEKATATKLTGMGLPEEQAIKSAKALSTPCVASPNPCTCFCTMKIKEDADMPALKAALASYAGASKKSQGKIHAAYGLSEQDGEIQFHEVFDSPGAMDAHIGNCFEFYVQTVPHTQMAEIVGTADSSELEWWKTSASAWGASKLVITAAI